MPDICKHCQNEEPQPTCKVCVYWNQDAEHPRGGKWIAGYGRCDRNQKVPKHKRPVYSDMCVICDYDGPYLGATPEEPPQ